MLTSCERVNMTESCGLRWSSPFPRPANCALLAFLAGTMTSSADKRHEKEKKRNPRAALDPLVAPPSAATSTGGASRMQMVGNALLAPFTSRRNDSNRMLADCASSRWRYVPTPN